MMKKRPVTDAPCVHTQAEKEVLPAGDVLPYPYVLGQAMHSSVPVVALYVPAAHATHDETDRY